MIQASACKAFDFHADDFLSRNWWRRLRWTLDQIESNNVLNLYQKQHLQHTAALDYQAGDTFKHHWEEANKLLTKTYNLCFPWKQKAGASKNQEIADLIKVWEKSYGSMKDPKVRDKMNDIAKAMRAKTAKGREKYMQEQKSEQERRKAMRGMGRKRRKH